MPFCRECGKQIEESWKVCPHCTAPIQIPITDSVVMVDNSTTINNDTEVISSAMKSATKCPNCNSLSPTQYACSKCRNIGFCDICVGGELASKRMKLLKSVKRQEGGTPKLNVLSELPLNVSLCNSCYQDEFTKKFPKCFNCDVNHKSLSRTESRCHICENLTCGRECRSQHYQLCDQVVEIRADINNSIEGLRNEFEPFGNDGIPDRYGYLKELKAIGGVIGLILIKSNLFTKIPKSDIAQDSFKELVSSLKPSLELVQTFVHKINQVSTAVSKINDGPFSITAHVNIRASIDNIKEQDPINSINEYRNISKKIIEKSNLENIDEFDLLKVLMDEDFAREMNYYNIFTGLMASHVWDLEGVKKLIQSKEDQK